MGTGRRRILLNLFELLDLGLMAFSFAVATLPDLPDSDLASFTQFFSMRVKVVNFVLFALLLLVWHIIFASFGLYRSKRLSGHRTEFFDLLKATSGGTLCLVFAALVFHIQMFTPLFLAVFWVVGSSTAATSRLALRYALKRIRIRGRNLRYLLVVGTNHRAIDFARRLEANPGLGYRIIGFVDVEWAGMEEFHKTGYARVCDLEGFPTFLRDRVVDEVVITLPIKSFYVDASRMVVLCQEQGIIIHFLSHLFNLKMARTRTEHLDDDSLITLGAGAPQGWALLVKRLLDIAISLLCIIVFAPVFLITALLIKLTSPGPVFFVQKRLGLNKRLIDRKSVV